MKKPKRKRRVFVVVLLSIVTLFALVILIVPPIVKHKIKKEIVQSLESTLYAEVKIGNIDISWRKRTFVVSDIKVSGIDDFEDIPMLSIKSIKINLDNAGKPSISKLLINELNIEGIELYFIVNEKGENCWKIKQDTTIDVNPSSMPEFRFNTFIISNASLFYSDDRTGQSFNIENLNINIDKTNDSTWIYNLYVEELNTRLGYHSKKTPSLRANGNAIVSNSKIEIHGEQYLNQFVTELNVNVNRNNKEESVIDLNIPICEYREFLSIFQPIAENQERFETSGYINGNIKMTGDFSYLNLPKIDAMLSVYEAKITNIDNDKSIFINSDIILEYCPLKGITDINSHKTSEIIIGENTLSLGLMAIPKNGKTKYLGVLEGMVDIADLNEILNLQKYKLGGTIAADGTISGTADTLSVNIASDLSIEASNLSLKNINTQTYWQVNSVAKLSPKAANLNIDFTRSNGLKYKHNIHVENIFESIYLGETLELQANTNLSRVSFNLPESGEMPENLGIGLNSAINLNKFYPKRFSIDWNLFADTLFINNELMLNAGFNIHSDSSCLEIKDITLDKDDGNITLEVSMHNDLDNSHLLNLNYVISNLSLDNEANDIMGLINGEANIEMSIKNDGKPNISTLNGYILLMPSELKILQDKLKKNTKNGFSFNDDDYLPVSQDSIYILITEGNIELLPFSIVSENSGIRGKGSLYQLDSIDFNFNAHIAQDYQSKSFKLFIKGIGLMQDGYKKTESEEVNLGIKITGTIKDPSVNFHLLK